MKMDILKSKKIIKLLKKHYGTTRPDLDFESLYELVVSVVLSAQTTDKQVNSVTPALFSKYPDFKSLSAAKISDVEKIINRVGFFRVKSKHIVNLSKKIIADFNGTVPKKMEELITLPGVGRKSANIILSFGYGVPAIAVDTHVMRISNRLGYTEDKYRKDPVKTESALVKIIPEKDWIASHLLFIRHGRDICKAQRPLCGACPVREVCPSRMD
jgi:endonuclease-3